MLWGQTITRGRLLSPSFRRLPSVGVRAPGLGVWTPKSRSRCFQSCSFFRKFPEEWKLSTTQLHARFLHSLALSTARLGAHLHIRTVVAGSLVPSQVHGLQSPHTTTTMSDVSELGGLPNAPPPPLASHPLPVPTMGPGDVVLLEMNGEKWAFINLKRGQ